MKGIILETDGKKMIVLSAQGEFYQVPNYGNCKIGQRVEIKKPRPVPQWTPILAMAATLVIVAGAAVLVMPLVNQEVTIVDPGVPLAAAPIVLGLQSNQEVCINIQDKGRSFDWEASCPIARIYIRTEEGTFAVHTADAKAGAGFVGPSAVQGEKTKIIGLAFVLSEEGTGTDSPPAAPQIEDYLLVDEAEFPTVNTLDLSAFSW